MERNERKPKGIARFDYADVEKALASLHGAEHVRETTFRARLKHLMMAQVCQFSSFYGWLGSGVGMPPWQR